MLVDVGMRQQLISDLKDKKIEEALVPLIEFIERIECACSHASSLKHLEFVLWKGIETSLDIKQLRAVLILNKHTKLFCPLKIRYPAKNDSKYKAALEIPSQKYHRNITTSADNDLQMKVKNLKRTRR